MNLREFAASMASRGHWELHLDLLLGAAFVDGIRSEANSKIFFDCIKGTLPEHVTDKTTIGELVALLYQEKIEDLWVRIDNANRHGGYPAWCRANKSDASSTNLWKAINRAIMYNRTAREAKALAQSLQRG